MVIFRCKQSGNTVSFSDQEAIKSMRFEPGYEEVIENALQEKTEETKTENEAAIDEVKETVKIEKKPIISRGRPKKK